ncbi:MAG TPA: ROK family protein [Spirochaetota bacterium]|nr:ROK family protein [Spirochaetota bacterium]
MAFGDKIDQRKTNKKNHIIDIMRHAGPLSKADAKKISGYSMDTVITVFNTLQREKLIKPAEGTQKEKGRKASFFKLNSQNNLYLGVTFNQSGIYSSLVSFSNEILESHFTRIPYPATLKIFEEKLVQHIQSVIERKKTYSENIISICCSVPGNIDTETGILASYTFLPFLDNFNFVKLCNTHFPGIPVYVDHNISNMTSYFLMDIDLMSHYSRVLVVSARTGAASGLIFNGDIVNGHGEMGHVRVSDTSDMCMCGRTGCLDCFFSYRNFAELLSNNGIDTDDESIPVQESVLKTLKEKYESGDPEFTKPLKEYLHYLSNALLDAINITAPHLVILTGELFRVYGDPVKEINDTIHSYLNDEGPVANYSRTRLMFFDLGTEIASLGICYHKIKHDWDYTS